MSITESLRVYLPEGILVLGALLVLGVDLAVGGRVSPQGRVRLAIGLAAVATLAGLVAVFGVIFGTEIWEMHGVEEKILSRGLVYLLGIPALFLSRCSRCQDSPAEYSALTLFAYAGLSTLCFADNFLGIFAALELAGLSLYLLAGFDKSRRESAEAGLKYFLYGGTASAFLLFGLSLLYGLTGKMDFAEVEAVLTPEISHSPLFIVAAGMVLVGLGYKVAAAPFHLWAPDTYEGAPTPSAAVIASVSKVGGFLLLARFMESFRLLTTPAFYIFAALAVASLLVGNFGALAQKNVRRLLAYSAIAHAGVLLLATSIAHLYRHDIKQDQVLWNYLLVYGLANIVAFGVVAVLEHAGRCETLSDLAGLWKRSPFLTICLSISILSLAGVPPLAGFFAKFEVFVEVLKVPSGQYAEQTLGISPVGLVTLFGLVLLAIAASAVALYYYLQILKAAFVSPPTEENAAADTAPSANVAPIEVQQGVIEATDSAAKVASIKIPVGVALALAWCTFWTVALGLARFLGN